VEKGVEMLWSSTIVKTDSDCPRQSLWSREGKEGEQWDGYRVGSYIHDWIYSKLTGFPEPSKDKLSISELVQADSLVKNFESMGDIHIPDNGTCIEQSYVSKILEGGMQAEWVPAPQWAIRGPDWDPYTAGKETVFRIQPDLFFIEGDTIVIYDWKTGMGRPSDSTLESDEQSIVYAAALSHMYPQMGKVRFVWWNIRHKTGRSIERSRHEWSNLARPIFKACYDKDQSDRDAIETDTRPGEHCGRCPFSKDCLSVSDGHESLPDVDLYRYSSRLSTLASRVSKELTKRLKVRTSPVKLPDGSVIGLQIKTSSKWRRGEKERGLQIVFDSLIEHGMNPYEFLDVRDSLGKWIERLPEDVSSRIQGLLTDFNRTVVIERKN
jgi:hypothetical protein|tara:strand:+ start:3631 stop:4770 length:1140 start_codon:yes stop_codon:yes gene_type:complete